MPTIVITPPGRFSLPKVCQLWEAREVLYRFGARDVTLRYRQTLLGVVWVVLQPLLTALVFALVFGRVAHLTTGGVAALVFVFTGLLAWNLFNGIISRAPSSLVSNRDLVSKVFFPRMLVPLATAYSSIVDFLVSTAFLVVLLIIYGINPGMAVVLVPVWTLMVILMASGIGLVASALTVRYRDVAYFVPFLLQFLLYASPIAYSIAVAGQVPGHLRHQSVDLAAPGVPVVVPPPAGPAPVADRPLAGGADRRVRRRGHHLRTDGARLRRRDLIGDAADQE